MRRRPVARWLALCVIFVAFLARAASAATPVLGLSGRTVHPRGHITITFELTRPGTAVFSIDRIAPVRRTVGGFEVRGHAGANRFLFPGRLDRRLLRPGTYRLTAEIDRARAVSPTFVVVPAASGEARPIPGESRPRRTLVVVFVLLAILFLTAAAIPERAVPGPRGAALLAAGRGGLAFVGFAALGAALALYLARAL